MAQTSAEGRAWQCYIRPAVTVKVVMVILQGGAKESAAWNQHLSHWANETLWASERNVHTSL